jgi:hypothetical protein
LRLVAGSNIVTYQGQLAALPGYRFERTLEGTLDRWSLGEGDIQRDYQLLTYIPGERSADQGPLTLLSDLRLELTVRYPKPQPTLGYEPLMTNTTSESVTLTMLDPPTAESLPQERVMKQGALTVATRFYWPTPPKGPVAGYTAPLQAWIETTIAGLTTKPIVLHSDLAQTYRPGHHNFYEDFAFEPRLDPDVEAAALAELQRMNIRALLLSAPREGTPTVILWGLDEKFRYP